MSNTKEEEKNNNERKYLMWFLRALDGSDAFKPEETFSVSFEKLETIGETTTLILKCGDKYFSTHYSVNSWSGSDERFWDASNNLIEVTPVEKTIVVYE